MSLGILNTLLILFSLYYLYIGLGNNLIVFFFVGVAGSAASSGSPCAPRLEEELRASQGRGSNA